MLNTVTGATMSRYPCIMLAGDMTFTRFFLFELSKAASHGSQILLHSRHIKAMGSDAFENLKASGNVTVIHAWKNPQTGHPAAIANQELSRMSNELLPLSIAGDPIQFQVNRNHLGWVLKCINNDGVFKTGDQATKVYPEATAKVKIQPKFKPRLVREWITQNSMVLDPSNKISLSNFPRGIPLC
ncbi:MAG: hypothetical protein P8L18_01925 [Verrucomicrobiota bacterium]|nr:hypothetical protein [Verrucomicrobiota bacterium]